MNVGQSVSLDALNEQTSTHGGHVADVVASGELDRLCETIEVLSDPAARAALEEADRPVDEGDVIRGADAIRALVEKRK